MVWVVAPIWVSALHTHAPTSWRSSTGRALLNPHQCSSAWIGAPLFHCSFRTPPPFFQALSLVWKLLNPHRPSAALIWHSSFSFRTPATQHFPSGAPLVPGGWSPFSSDYIILPSKPQYSFAAKKHLITPVLAITNRAEGYWNSISAACQVRIISEYKERLQLLCCCDELCVPAFVTPDEMGEVVDDINTMFHRYHLTV